MVRIMVMPRSTMEYAQFKADVQFVCEKRGMDFKQVWALARTAASRAAIIYHQIAHSYREQQ